MSTFSDQIKKLREESGKTCFDVSLDTGLNKNIVYQYEHEERSPNMKSLIKLADYFGVSMDYLAGRTNNPAVNR